MKVIALVIGLLLLASPSMAGIKGCSDIAGSITSTVGGDQQRFSTLEWNTGAIWGTFNIGATGSVTLAFYGSVDQATWIPLRTLAGADSITTYTYASSGVKNIYHQIGSEYRTGATASPTNILNAPYIKMVIKNTANLTSVKFYAVYH